MTFCLGITVRDGLVGLADTRVTSGSEFITARKLTVHQHGLHSMFVMVSGLRSASDKALTYFEEEIEERGDSFDRLYKAVNALGRQVRRAVDEDEKALAARGLKFNLHSIVGGQLENDRAHKLYLLYPEGNWVEIGEGSPYTIIGAGGYGKPLLDRALHYDLDLRQALKIAYLAFDATRTSANDVEFPLDVVLYGRDSYDIVQHRFHREDLLDMSDWWQKRMRDSVAEIPSASIETIFSRLKTR